MSLQISMVIFQQKPRLSMKEFQRVLSSRWKDLPTVVEASEPEGALSCRIGAADVVVAVMDAPIPWSDLEGPCATSILWPDAAADIRHHPCHGLVTVRGELSPVALSMLLTQVTAAVMKSTPEAIGVYWGNATMVIPKDFFVDCAVKMRADRLPVPLWVDGRVGWAEGKKNVSAGFTTGLAALGLMELEAVHATESPSDLKDRFEAVSHYLLENGPVIKDGDTLGEHEEITVHLRESVFGIKGEVMQLSYSPTKEKKSWWKRW